MLEAGEDIDMIQAAAAEGLEGALLRAGEAASWEASVPSECRCARSYRQLLRTGVDPDGIDASDKQLEFVQSSANKPVLPWNDNCCGFFAAVSH